MPTPQAASDKNPASARREFQTKHRNTSRVGGVFIGKNVAESQRKPLLQASFDRNRKLRCGTSVVPKESSAGLVVFLSVK
jgi:hypothetical protein